MAFEDVLAKFGEVSFNPRTLQVNIPAQLTAPLSDTAVRFFAYAYFSEGQREDITWMQYADADWSKDPEKVRVFMQLDEEVRLEILAFLTLFIHEYTHKTDFLISPFGLLFYANCMYEYWTLQTFIPQVLDSAEMIDNVRFLVNFEEGLVDNAYYNKHLKSMWEELKPSIHASYSWGDVGDILPLKRFIASGWHGQDAGLSSHYLGVEQELEPITLLEFFCTFRSADKGMWYLRPLTIFETKAVVNSLLYILDLLGEAGLEDCSRYYEEVYLSKKDELPEDYFFLLDMGAMIYGLPDFEAALKAQHFLLLKSILSTLSGICWYALHTLPLKTGEDAFFANPIIRLWAAFNFMTAVLRQKIKIEFNTVSEVLMHWEKRSGFGKNFQKPIAEVIPRCLEVVDDLIKKNQKETWNPAMKAHFDHILTIIRPHFADREYDYFSKMGMPDDGNPTRALRTEDQWLILYDDYVTPPEVFGWYDIRGNLFFTLLKPHEELIRQLDKHFRAFYFLQPCRCNTIIAMWVSRFFETVELKCPNCGREYHLTRDEVKIIDMDAPEGDAPEGDAPGE